MPNGMLNIISGYRKNGSPSLTASFILDHIEKCLDLPTFCNASDFVDCHRIRGTKCHASFALIHSQIRSPFSREVIVRKGPEMDPEVINITLLPAVIAELKGKQFAQVQRVVFPPLDLGLYKRTAKDNLKTELSRTTGVYLFLRIFEGTLADGNMNWVMIGEW